jgi:flagellar basal-body rod protein FlgB
VKLIIKDLTSAGALPTLEKMFLFAGQRQRIIANNIANIDTPNFQGVDVDPRSFQKVLGDAVKQRRAANGGSMGELNIRQTSQVQTHNGRMHLNPETPTSGVLFHDRNQRDLEKMMQQLVENASMFRVASDLMRKNQSQLKLAIAERVI